MNRLYIMIAVLMTGFFPMMAFSGAGSGTEKDPYIITTADELFEMRNDLDAHYKLGNDIDLTVFINEDSPRYGWIPIGSSNSPFTGSLEGNNHLIRGLYINRENEDYVGLFGYVSSCAIKNIGIINPQIHGKSYVGAVVGYVKSVKINSVAVVGGSIKGTNYIGGICGYKTSYRSDDEFKGCIVDSFISGNENIGGIIGAYESYTALSENVFSGRIYGKGAIGGIAGYVNETCNNNIVTGSIYSSEGASGICGSSSQSTPIVNNACVMDTISGNLVHRIAYVSSQSKIINYACHNTVVIVNGKEQTGLEDTPENGIALSLRMLKKQSTYEGIGFDFTKTWKIKEGEGLPYLKVQSDPLEVTSFVGGSKSTISGTGVGSGTVGVLIGDNLYESYIVDGSWSVSLGSVRPGTLVKVFGVETGKLPSPTVVAVATQDSSTPDYKQGDSNGDGVVDAADVVGIINYIIGKPSVSFNALNADVTGDGQVLVDDAVEAVELIMNAQ